MLLVCICRVKVLSQPGGVRRAEADLGLMPQKGSVGGSRLEEEDTAVRILCVVDMHTPNFSHEPAVNPNHV